MNAQTANALLRIRTIVRYAIHSAHRTMYILQVRFFYIAILYAVRRTYYYMYKKDLFLFSFYSILFHFVVVIVVEVVIFFFFRSPVPLQWCKCIHVILRCIIIEFSSNWWSSSVKECKIPLKIVDFLGFHFCFWKEALLIFIKRIFQSKFLGTESASAL